MNLIRVGWVGAALGAGFAFGQEERIVDCAGLNFEGSSLRTSVNGVEDTAGLTQVLNPKIEIDFDVKLEGQLENPFSDPISSQLDILLTVVVHHPGGILEVNDAASVLLDGGPIDPGQSLGFKVEGQDVIRELMGSEFITDLGAIGRLYAEELMIRVKGDVSLFSAEGGEITLEQAVVVQGDVRLQWDESTASSLKDWNQDGTGSWFDAVNWTPNGVPTSSQTAIFGYVNESGTANGLFGSIANPAQVDVFSGSFSFDSDLDLNADRLRVGINQAGAQTSLQLKSSTLSFNDVSVGAPQGALSNLQILTDSTLTATRLDVGVAGSAELVLKDNQVQAGRLRVGYAPIEALEAYDGRLELWSNATIGGSLFELQGVLDLAGSVVPMQFESVMIDALGQATFPGNLGQVENRGLLRVASGGALISGDYLQAGEEEPVSGCLQTRFNVFGSELNQLQIEGQAQLDGGLEVFWPNGVAPTTSEVLLAGSIIGEFPVRHLAGGDGASSVKFSLSNAFGSQVLVMENAGPADPLPMMPSTGFDFPSGFLDVEIGDINNDGLADVAAVVLDVQGLAQVELQLAQLDADNQLSFLKVNLDAPLGTTDITFGDATFDQLPDLCVAGSEGTFAFAAGTDEGGFAPFQVVLAGYGEVADIRALSAPDEALNVLLLDATNSRLRRIRSVETLLGSGFSDQDEGGTEDDPTEIDPVPGTGKKNNTATITSSNAVSTTSGSKKKSRGNNDTGSSGTGDSTNPLTLVTIPAIHVTLHRDRNSFEVYRINSGDQLGGGVEFSFSEPGAIESMIPVDIDLGDFDGDGDADIAVAFTKFDNQGFPEGVVRILRTDWDGSGGVTFVDTPLRDAGPPIEAIRAGDFDGDGIDELLLFREPIGLVGSGLSVDVLRRTAVLGDIDGDGQVGFADLLQILARWGDECVDCSEDLNGNGVVDFEDVLTLLANWTGTP